MNKIKMMEIILIIFLMVYCRAFADDSVHLNEVTIQGTKITVGQSADSVLRQIRAQRYETSGFGTGDIRKGYYSGAGGEEYVITFSNISNRSNELTIRDIERVSSSTTRSELSSSGRVTGSLGRELSREDIILAQRKFKIEVLSFDTSEKNSSGGPYTDWVRLKIINQSERSIPYLTVLTSRFNEKGDLLGESRKPEIPVDDIMPGEAREIDYYPEGRIKNTMHITVEIDSLAIPEK